jgi:hypothetical protein
VGLADALGRKRVIRVNVDPQAPTRYQSPELRAITVAFFECHQVIGYPGSMKHGRVSGAHKVWETQGTHVGRSSLTFFSVSLSRSTGSTRPDAFPKDTMVPLRLIILKSSLNLQSVRDIPVFRRRSRCFPYTVVDHVHSFAIRELEHAFDCVLLFVEDNVVSTVCPRKLRLLCRGGSSNDCGTTGLGHLSVQQSSAAGHSVDENSVSIIHVIGLSHLRECCEALNERGSSDTSRNLVWYSIGGSAPVHRNILLE